MKLLLICTVAFGFIENIRTADAKVYGYCLEDSSAQALPCEFDTLRQCQATASGGLGTCIENIDLSHLPETIELSPNTRNATGMLLDWKSRREQRTIERKILTRTN